MEPVTHLLSGACLARSGLNRRAAYTTLAMSIAAYFPDIDSFWALRGPVEGFTHHRGITHTFAALPVEAAVILAAFYGLHQWRSFRAENAGAGARKPLTAAPVRWGALYGFILLALASHLLLDFTNNYGVRPLFPFAPRWHAASIVFIFDPWMFAVFLLPVILPPLFALIGSEVGARKQVFRGRGIAIVSLVFVLGWWSLRLFAHARAEQIGFAQSMADLSPLGAGSYVRPVRVLANPDPFNPFRWHLVTDFDSFYQLDDVNVLSGSLTPSQEIYAKHGGTPAIVAAQASPLGRAYMDWSPVPIITEIRPGDPQRRPSDASITNTVVTFRDPRFMLDLPLLRSRPNPPLTGEVELDEKNRVIGQTMDGSAER